MTKLLDLTAAAEAADADVLYTVRDGADRRVTVAQLRAGLLRSDDASVSNAREWTGETVNLAEAESGVATVRRAWTAQRVWQAIAAWWAESADKAKLDGIATGANAYVHPDHRGDVTSSGDGATAIAADAVTNAKLSDMAAATIKGRATGAGAGDPADLTATEVRDILNVEDGAQANRVTSVAGRTGAVTLAKADVDLGNVNNTADAAKSVASATRWATARTLTIGESGKRVNGAGNVSWSLAEIGAAAVASSVLVFDAQGDANAARPAAAAIVYWLNVSREPSNARPGDLW